jgi:hypothetical protein
MVMVSNHFPTERESSIVNDGSGRAAGREQLAAAGVVFCLFSGTELQRPKKTLNPALQVGLGQLRGFVLGKPANLFTASISERLSRSVFVWDAGTVGL